MTNADVHAKDFKRGDVVYVPETVYLNQKHERYHHRAWENIETIQVKVIRTVFKGISRDTYRPFNTSGDAKFARVYSTFSEAVDSLALHPYILDRFKIQGAQAFLDKAFNIAEPDVLQMEVDAKQMEMMR